MVTTYLYDSLNRLTNMVHQIGTTNLASYGYTLNPSGHKTGAVEVLLQENGSYLTNAIAWQYDGMYRLTNEMVFCSEGAYSYTNAFKYDKVGNRLSLTRTGSGGETIGYLYNANDELTNETSSLSGTITYAYDQNGSITNKTSEGTVDSYEYDVANKLTGVSVNGTLAASYLYNDDGIRISATAGGTTTLFLIDDYNPTGNAQVFEELQAPGGTPNMSYVIGDEVLSQCGSTASAPFYFLQDGHGNNRQLIQLNGAVTSHYSYESYGAVQGSSSTTASAAPTTKLYCGEQFDSDLGMYNLRARYYDPANGRFNQRDINDGNDEDPLTLHKYAYADCDPVNEVDPAGQQGELADVLVSVAINATLSAAAFGTIGAAFGGVKGMLAGIVFGAALAIAIATEQWAEASWQGFIDAMLTLMVDEYTDYWFPGTLPQSDIFSDTLTTFAYGFAASVYNELLAENDPVMESLIGFAVSATNDLGDFFNVYFDSTKSPQEKQKAGIELVEALLGDGAAAYFSAQFIKHLKGNNKKYIYITGAPQWLLVALDKRLLRLTDKGWANIQEVIRKCADGFAQTLENSAKALFGGNNPETSGGSAE